MTKTIFAHESGGTFQMERSLVRIGRDNFANARKPVTVVTDATRKHERETAEGLRATARFLDNTDTTWRAAVEAETESLEA